MILMKIQLQSLASLITVGCSCFLSFHLKRVDAKELKLIKKSFPTATNKEEDESSSEEDESSSS